MSDLYILGASGHGREVAEVVKALECASDDWPYALRGFLDDDPDLNGRIRNGVTVLGSTSVLAEAFDRENHRPAVVLGVGYPETKLRMVRRLNQWDLDWPALVHPHASAGVSVHIGHGALIQAGAVLTTNVDLGDFTTINVSASVSHDCTVERFATVSPGAHLGGDVQVGEGALIGIGASVIQGVKIGDWSIVGAGAAVIEDVPDNSVVVGVPARVVRTFEPGWYHA